jgi:hypothetical protein
LIWSGAILIRLAILLATSAFLMGANLPKNVPIPEARPETTPVPERTDKVEKSEPQQTEPKGDKAKPEEEQKAVEDDYVPPPIEKEDPVKLATCLSELKALGVAFKESPAIDENNGCGIDQPITVTSLGQNVSLKPEGEMRCQTALSLAHWTANVVIPSLKQAKPDETLSALNQASTYVCRKRNNAKTGKISEHAHGNAVDIAGLTFKSGATFTIKPRMKDSTMDGALQRAITTAACLYFTTVLDPGSDAAHEAHLHLDIIERKSGYRLCW